MIRLLWFDVPLPAELQLLGHEFISFLANLLAWGIIAFVIRFLLFRTAKWLTRKTKTEVDDVILHASRVPLWLIIIIIGIAKSLGFLESASMPMYLERVLRTTLIVVIMYWAWRLFKDVLIYYGEQFAERTETNVDDVLVPVVNRLGPIAIVVVGGAIILQCWGVNL
jgi:MscS family membrane protein